MLHAFRKRQSKDGGTRGMVSPPAALAARITRWAVGGR